ncbi:general stress protein CsbD [Chitinophaga sp. SYP-B3965]|uniref:CsbD family protein n=1 Tax=Chitinophaga sp. SYP-B3965 TaxID=2663120 RepID=UPI0012998083|nr:CsbD family protein [Chitinophaga sp. SYP-B3965]MRG45967.1 general stress protein CsbD [Chitinophaga sp. SYP-B3965]
MDILMIKDRWNEIKEKLKSMFVDLSDTDLFYEQGKDDRLIGQIQIRLGKTRDEVINLIRSL